MYKVTGKECLANQNQGLEKEAEPRNLPLETKTVCTLPAQSIQFRGVVGVTSLLVQRY